MAGERRINWGLDASDAKYRSEDTDPNGGDLVLAEDLDGGTVLLRWNDSEGEWVYGGPVNMGGEDLTNVGSISTEGVVVNDTYHYAAFYDGADPDARLDNAISSASGGDVIHLENETYRDDRTISGVGNRGTKIVGPGNPVGSESTIIDANWTISTIRVTLESVGIDDGGGGSLQVNGDGCLINECEGPLTVGGDDVRVLDGYSFDGTITFESGTSGGLVDGYVRTSVTDNGNNTVGDIG